MRASKKRDSKRSVTVAAKSRSSASFTNVQAQPLQLQQLYGNSAVQLMYQAGQFQTKLKIGAPGDKYEREADRVADRVMGMPEPQIVSREEDQEEIKTKPLSERISPLVQCKAEEEEEEPAQPKLIQREEEEETAQPKLLQCQELEEEAQPKLLQCQELEEEAKAKLLQREEGEEEEKAQAKEDSSAPSTAPASVESGISSLRGGGSPLSESSRSFFEPRFGADFSGVRVHTDSKANHLAGSINAKAFTSGKDVVFGSGQYSPETSDGKKLLAHELTHTVQQKGVQKKSANCSHEISRKIFSGNSAALNIQRAPGGKSNIEKLDEMLDRFNVPEKEVIALLGKLDPAEKKTVLSGRYKKPIASALNVGEMVKAVNNLGPPLVIKLDWVEEAAGSASSIDYGQIKKMITSKPLTPTEKGVFKLKPWRDFFVDVCTNKTIVDAVNDIGFDLTTKLIWMKEEGTSWKLVKPVITGTVDPKEKIALYGSTTMKSFFEDVCGNDEMAAAVTLIGGTLLQKLIWMEGEGSSWKLVKPVIIGTADPNEKTAIYGNKTMNSLFVDICNDKTIVEATELLGGTWPQKDALMKAEGVTIPVNMQYSSVSRLYGYSKGNASMLHGLKVAPNLVPASGFKQKSSSFYIYNKKWSDGLGAARLGLLGGDCGLYAKELIKESGRAPLNYPPPYGPARPGIGLAPASDLTLGNAYFIVPKGAGAGAVEEDVFSPWNNKEKVRKTLTNFHVATVVAKDGGTVITSEVNAAFAHKRIKPWFAMYTGNAGFFGTFKKEYKKGGVDPDLYKI